MAAPEKTRQLHVESSSERTECVQARAQVVRRRIASRWLSALSERLQPSVMGAGEQGVRPLSCTAG